MKGLISAYLENRMKKRLPQGICFILVGIEM